MPERAVLSLAIAQTLIWASTFYIFAALLLWWEADLGWTRGQLTGAFTVSLLVSACVAPFVGRFIDRGLGSVVMGSSTLLSGVSIGGLSLVTEVWQFYAVWILIGIFNTGCLYEPCFALITRARGTRGRPAIVTITLFAGFASTLSFPLASTLADDHGWRTAVQVFSAIAVLGAAPLMYLGAHAVETKPFDSPVSRKNHPPGHAGRSGFLRQPQFWFLGLGFACGSMLQQITINHLLPILQDRGVVMGLAIMTASLVGPMQVAGRIAMATAGARASNHLVAVLSFVSMGLSITMLMMAGVNLFFIIAFAVLFGAAHGVVSIVRPGLTWEILGSENFGAKSGGLASLFFIGGAVAPFVGSVIWEGGGYNTVLAFLVILSVAGLSLYILAHRSVNAFR